ncbi:MAG: caspase family protein [Acidimicrobiia bacterium]
MSRGMSLHIGLNAVDVEHYQWDGALAACEFDARDMEALAASLGYAPRTVLLTKDATARKVIAGIKKAAKALVAGDTFLVTYAGHGGQVPDTNGDEAKKDPNERGEYADKYDETWVLYDRELIDDELYALWAMFAPKVRIIVLSDSCHSGTITRDRPPTIDPLPSRRMPPVRAQAVYEANKKLYDGIQRKIPSRDAKSIKASVTLISGCLDNQTSGDGDRNGRFTGELLTVWNNGNFGAPLPRLHKAVLNNMPPFQTPNYYTIGANDAGLAKKPAFRI